MIEEVKYDGGNGREAPFCNVVALNAQSSRAVESHSSRCVGVIISHARIRARRCPGTPLDHFPLSPRDTEFGSAPASRANVFWSSPALCARSPHSDVGGFPIGGICRKILLDATPFYLAPKIGVRYIIGVDQEGQFGLLTFLDWRF